MAGPRPASENAHEFASSASVDVIMHIRASPLQLCLRIDERNVSGHTTCGDPTILQKSLTTAPLALASYSAYTS